MKIGLYNESFPPLIDGVSNAVMNYAKYITKNFGSAAVVTPRYPHVTDDYPFEVYRYPSVGTAGRIPYRVGNPFLPTTIIELRQKNFDLLHVHSPFASAVLVQQQTALKPFRLPQVLTYHTKYDLDIDKFVKDKKFNRFAKSFVLKNINRADEVWCVTDGAGKWLQSTGFQRDYIVMPNGTDFARGRSTDAELAELDRVYLLKPDEYVFLFCGRMMWYKNVKLVVDTLVRAKEAGIKFRMFFVGEGTDRAAIEHYVGGSGIKDRCVFTGAINDREKVRVFFSRADLFIFPSTYDTSGLVVKEAAACGCPTLLVRDSCAAECVADGRNGLTAEENADSLAAALVAAVKSEGALKRIGRAAEEEVYLSWEDAVARACERYGVVYDNYLSRNAQKRKRFAKDKHGKDEKQ